jgi:hypothetical protein
MANFFSRAFDIFCDYGLTAKPVLAHPTSMPPRSRAACDAEELPVVVGQGAPNETFVTIRDVAHLFIQEADHVVHFEQDFEMVVSDTPVGKKLLPELFPRWQERDVHPCSLKEAILNVIRRREPLAAPLQPVDATAKAHSTPEAAPPAKVARSEKPNKAVAASFSHDYAGVITAWGEEKFPRRDAEGDKEKFYTSFAIRLTTRSGKEQIVQGEGLKDAITQCGCEVGDHVGIKRLHKEKVQAFNRSGEPRKKDGQPIFFDKWVWSIKHIK